MIRRTSAEKAEKVARIERLAKTEGISAKDACKKLGIHCSAFYAWKSRAKLSGDGTYLQSYAVTKNGKASLVEHRAAPLNGRTFTVTDWNGMVVVTGDGSYFQEVMSR